jgi:hypothetical protein
MAVLVAVETLVLVLLTLLVGGLLRSHAEILRRLELVSPEASSGVNRQPEGPGSELLPQPREHVPQAFDVAGTTLAGDAVKLAVKSERVNTLLAFLSSGCTKCRTFWEGLGNEARQELPEQLRVVVVTKGSSFESPAKLLELAPSAIPLVMSSQAWSDYDVPGSPYFVYVDGKSGQVHGEGSAGSWSQVASLLRDALADQALSGQNPGDGTVAELPPRSAMSAQTGRRAPRRRTCARIGSFWLPASIPATRASIPVPQRSTATAANSRSTNPGRVASGARAEAATGAARKGGPVSAAELAPAAIGVGLAVVAGLRSTWSP